jgi:hypothetical protein
MVFIENIYFAIVLFFGHRLLLRSVHRSVRCASTHPFRKVFCFKWLRPRPGGDVGRFHFVEKNDLLY